MTAPRSETPRLEFADDLPRQESRAFRYGREAASLVLIAGAVFLTLALASFSHDPAVSEVTGTNWVGPVGEALANVFVSTLGLAAWIIPVELVLISLPLFRNKPTMASVARIGGDTVVNSSAGSIISIAKAAGVPVFTNDPTDTARGALFSLGASYPDVGRTIGALSAKLLRGTDPRTIGVENVVPELLTLNQRSRSGVGGCTQDHHRWVVGGGMQSWLLRRTTWPSSRSSGSAVAVSMPSTA